MPNDYVLRITHECGNTADIRAGRERDQIRQHGEFPSPNHLDDERRQH